MDKIDKLLNLYARKGGKANRREQIGRIRAVLDFSGITNPEQLGNKHIVSFYKHLREKKSSQRTQYYYWLALCVLYEVLGRKEPPKPRTGSPENEPEQD